MPARANHDLFILTFNIVDLMQKLDRSMLKHVITWKQMSFLKKIISPPPWISLLTSWIWKPSTLNWPLPKPASIFVSVMRSMSNLSDSSQLLIPWNLNPVILLVFMCPILVYTRYFLLKNQTNSRYQTVNCSRCHLYEKPSACVKLACIHKW